MGLLVAELKMDFLVGFVWVRCGRSVQHATAMSYIQRYDKQINVVFVFFQFWQLFPSGIIRSTILVQTVRLRFLNSMLIRLPPIHLLLTRVDHWEVGYQLLQSFPTASHSHASVPLYDDLRTVGIFKHACYSSTIWSFKWFQKTCCSTGK